MAMSFGVQMAHHEEPQVSSHLLASIPHGTYVEAFHPARDPVYWRLLGNRPDTSSGTFALPTAPGLGWELDEEFIKEFRVDG
jgi:L-alanine-DL-glutamate epimerase-like enolase superfamily enzyme